MKNGIKKGLDLYIQSDYEEAITCFDKAIELNPAAKEAWTFRAIALHYLGKLKEAVSCYNKAIAIDSEYRPPLEGKELALKVQKESEEGDIREWLHPEIDNFLVPEEDFLLRPPEAKTGGAIVRLYGQSPENLNPLTVETASFSTGIKNYCRGPFALRQF